MKKSILALALLLSMGSFAQDKVMGYVFDDSNGNGKKERREKGIAEVAVTNGREVVLTDEKGRYELPVNEDAIIAVIKPSGFQVRTNSKNQPHFYYIHKPNGSPTFKFKGWTLPGNCRVPWILH